MAKEKKKIRFTDSEPANKSSNHKIRKGGCDENDNGSDDCNHVKDNHSFSNSFDNIDDLSTEKCTKQRSKRHE